MRSKSGLDSQELDRELLARLALVRTPFLARVAGLGEQLGGLPQIASRRRSASR